MSSINTKADGGGAEIRSKRLALPKASDEDIAAKFKSIDKDNNGIITVEEFFKFMNYQKFPVSSSYVKELNNSIDADKDGLISLTEFSVFYRKREEELVISYETLLHSAWKSAYRQDVNVNPDRSREPAKIHRKLNAASLRQAFSVLGIKASDDEIRNFIAHVDTDSDGTISFEEYRSMLLLLPANNPKASFDVFRSKFSAVDYGQSEYAPAIEATDSAALGQEETKTTDFSSTTTPTSKTTPDSNFVFSKNAKSLISGGIAGIISRTGTAPIDRLKTIMQAGGPNASTSLIDGVKNIYAKGGFRSFYLGNGVNCTKVAPETAFKMYAFDQFKTLLALDPGAISAQERFIAGGLAGATSQMIVYPLEIVKTRLALSAPGVYGGMFSCMSTIIREEGFTALYKGLSTSVIGVIPYAGIDLMVNSILKEYASEYYVKQQKEPNAFTILACGMISSTVAMSITYPIGLIRTRLQASGMPGRPVYNSPIDAIGKIFATEGVLGFFRGFVPNLLKVAPAAALSYGVYDSLNKSL